MPYIIVLLSLLVGIGRFLIPGHELSAAGTYEAFAHILVGALLVMSFQRNKVQMAAIVSLAVITLLEVVMFALFKHSH